MRWEELTSEEFARAVRETGVCVLALGVVEKHGDHLPLGTDFLNGHTIACLAAEKEPAVVFPPFYFGQIYEARCFPGTITLKPTLLLEVLLGILDEIGRNGFRKIVVYNAHGGNINLVRFLAQCTLWDKKPYSLYVPMERLTPQRRQLWQETCETAEHGHACECETSITLANYPGLVRMERVPSGKVVGAARNRLAHLPPTFCGIAWYANYPDHYAGDARTASAKKGRFLRQLIVDSLAEYIAAVKSDSIVPGLECEFFGRVARVGADPNRRCRSAGRRKI
ncbi:MAG: creatininase family protein [Kiritimatiellae bacterium]|nr:creatininase family protein [Kiritimatiellia bacterium]